MRHQLELYSANDAIGTSALLARVDLSSEEGAAADDLFEEHLGPQLTPLGHKGTAAAALATSPAGRGGQLFYCAHDVKLARELPSSLLLRLVEERGEEEECEAASPLARRRIIFFGLASEVMPASAGASSAAAERHYAEPVLGRTRLTFQHEEGEGWVLACAALCAERHVRPALDSLNGRWGWNAPRPRYAPSRAALPPATSARCQRRRAGQPGCWAGRRRARRARR